MKILLSILILTSFLMANDFEKGFSKLSTEQMAELLAQMIGKQLPRRLDEITIAKETFFNGDFSSTVRVLLISLILFLK